MFKGLGENLNLGGFFGKNTTTDNRRSAPATQEGGPQPYKVLTLGDLPKLGASATAAPTSAPLAAPTEPTLVLPRIETTQSMTWSDGPTRSLPSDHYVPSPDGNGLKSYAASLVSPNTPQPNKYDQAWNSNGLAPPVPVPATNPFYSRADDEQDEDNRSQYDNKSFFNYYANDQTSPNPQVSRNESTKSSKSNNGPTLKTNMLNLDGWSPSSSRFSNPFGISPQDQYPGARYQYGPYGRDVSPVSPNEPTSQEIRYSDCGVNPFQGLDEQARMERDDGEVGNIWDMITGKAQEIKRKPAPTSSPKINIDTSALFPKPTPGPSNLRRSLTNYQIPEPQSARSPGVSSPSEWFKDIIIQYEGRPTEINRAMSYMPTPSSPHPAGLSPPEITAVAVPYLATIENELEELRRTQTNPQAEVQTQQERDRVRDLIQRQLAHEQAYDALEQATGGKRLTRHQDDPAKIWEEIDLTGVRKSVALSIPMDRQSISSAVTTWPTFENGVQTNVPPVPRIPEQHTLAPVTEAKESRFAKALRSPFSRTQPKQEPQPVAPAVFAAPVPFVVPVSPEDSEIPIAFDGSLGPAKHLSMNSVTTFPGPDFKPKRQEEEYRRPSVPESDVDIYSRPAPAQGAYTPARETYNPFTPERDTYPRSDNRDTFAERFAPSNIDQRSDTEFTLNEKVPSPGHARNESTNTVSAPPPYSRGASPNPKSRDERRFSTVTEDAPIQSGRRFPVRASTLPRLSTGSSQGPQRLEATVTGLSQMQFTPTTPHHARYSVRGRPLGGNVNLQDIGFRSNNPADLRDRAEKKRQRQEKRQKLFGRGGSLYLCGLCCCFTSTNKKIKIYFWTFFISLVIIATTVGTVLAIKASNSKRPAEDSKPLQLINLPNLPPMPADEITVTPRLVNTVNTCVAPSTAWSCKPPKALTAGGNPEQPIFRWKVWAMNSSADIASPNPILPLVDEYKNMSKIDGVIASPLEGEPTNFYITMLESSNSTKSSSSSEKVKRSHVRHFPRAETTTGSAPAASNQALAPPVILPPQYSSQQLRFFDRGLPTEHFKFITHFQKTIYLRTITADSTPSGSNKLDADGGVAPSEARFVCRWPETRFVTKIFTRPDLVDEEGKRKFIVDPTTIGVIKEADAGGFGGYAIQIEEDIATYDTSRRGFISCFSIDDRGKIDPTSEQKRIIQMGLNTGKAGVDYKGCQCAWSNFKSSTGQGL